MKDDWIVNIILFCFINLKLEGIKSYLDEVWSSFRLCFYIIFCSGVSGGVYFNVVVDWINIYVRWYVEGYRIFVCFGIVVMDFLGWLLIYDLFMINVYVVD